MRTAFVLANALMKKGLKRERSRTSVWPFVLANALMKKGLKPTECLRTAGLFVLANALMKKGLKQRNVLLYRLEFGARECPDEEGIET